MAYNEGRSGRWPGQRLDFKEEIIMKKILRGAALLLAAVLLVGTLAACGGNNAGSQASSQTAESSQAETSSQASEPEASGVTGETQTWGNITLLVPEGMTLKGGSSIDPESKDALTLTLDENPAHYIMVTVVEPETAENSVATTKEMNNGASEVYLSTGMGWNGVAYKYAGTTDCFQMYAKTGDGKKAVLVGAAWFAYDGDVASAVLNSIKVQ